MNAIFKLKTLIDDNKHISYYNCRNVRYRIIKSKDYEYDQDHQYQCICSNNHPKKLTQDYIIESISKRKKVSVKSIEENLCELNSLYKIINITPCEILIETCDIFLENINLGKFQFVLNLNNPAILKACPYYKISRYIFHPHIYYHDGEATVCLGYNNINYVLSSFVRSVNRFDLVEGVNSVISMLNTANFNSGACLDQFFLNCEKCGSTIIKNKNKDAKKCQDCLNLE